DAGLPLAHRLLHVGLERQPADVAVVLREVEAIGVVRGQALHLIEPRALHPAADGVVLLALRRVLELGHALLPALVVARGRPAALALLALPPRGLLRASIRRLGLDLLDLLLGDETRLQKLRFQIE